MHRNDRKIVDLKTGIEFEQHKMLKILLERSKMKRNEWHHKAQKLVTRSLGSPTKLSDIFNGKTRSLPMRDIVPYIQALGMNKKETDYYIGEFFKAYCDENLHQYISTRSKSKQNLVLEQRIKVKDFELTMLKKEIHRLRHVDIPMTIYHKSKLPKLDLSELSQDNIRIAEAFSFFNKENNIGNVLVQNDLNPDFHEHNSKIEELSYESFFWEEALPLFHWFIILNLIKHRRNDSIFINFISLYIPENFFLLMSGVQDHKDFSPPEFRSNLEVIVEILADFRTYQPEQFKQEYDSRKNKEEKLINPNKKTITFSTETYKKQTHFKNYIVAKFDSKLENLPKEVEFLKISPFEPCDIDLIDYVFDQYIAFELNGMSYSMTLDELFKLQNPFSCANQLCNLKVIDDFLNLTQRKMEFICEKYGHENPLNNYTNHPDFPILFCSDYKAGKNAVEDFIRSFHKD